ncbi:hypothetical protein FQZ97_1218650 [compost metagenome]
MIARSLEQGFDFGKTGVEMQLVEGRFPLRHQAVQTQFGDGFAYHLHRHAVNAAFQLFDIDHDSSLSRPGRPRSTPGIGDSKAAIRMTVYAYSIRIASVKPRGSLLKFDGRNLSTHKSV